MTKTRFLLRHLLLRIPAETVGEHQTDKVPADHLEDDADLMNLAVLYEGGKNHH